MLRCQTAVPSSVFRQARATSAFASTRRVAGVTEKIPYLDGSDDLFPDRLHETYRPHQSVNFVTARPRPDRQPSA